MTRGEIEGKLTVLQVRNRSILEASAKELLACETLDEAALRVFFEKLKPV